MINNPNIKSPDINEFNSASTAGRLGPAHKGYIFQDLMSAFVLVRALLDRPISLTIDRKNHEADKFDDLDIRYTDRRVRWQFKHSEMKDRSLSLSDFSNSSSSLNIVSLLQTANYPQNADVEEFRLSTTWAPPNDEDGLLDYLEELEDQQSTVVGVRSRCFKLNAEKIWPANSAPVWGCLTSTSQDWNDNRGTFISFADRFVIELDIPSFSADLQNAGPIEMALLNILNEGVGIGRFPNLGRLPVDVAALAITLATKSRAEGRVLSPKMIEVELNIKTDYGRINQTYPIDETKYHHRPSFRQEIRAAIEQGSHKIIVGPPGCGKSWELTQIEEELEKDGFLVARHYCFLSPGDDAEGLRVTSNILFANLLAELSDKMPSLKEKLRQRYSAGPVELENALKAATEEGRRVVLIVDGLDHISRVRSYQGNLSQADTDIVEKIASLAIPAGVVFLIGSQPGQHLQPLKEKWEENGIELTVPKWSNDDMLKLFELHEIGAVVQMIGFEPSDFLEALAVKADGSPLFGRYLAEGFKSAYGGSDFGNPMDWLAEMPAIDGDIRQYYEYLYSKASADGYAVADVLAFTDFSISASELSEILKGVNSHRISLALSQLAPILTSARGQGGIRIFHESFRRFMVEKLEEDGVQIKEVLQPVIAWLEGRGFFTNARSYWFLIPLLLRADDTAAILDKINTRFVSDSIAHGFTLEPIQKNLLIAADVAAKACDWPSLARISELYKSAANAFEDTLPIGYWKTYLLMYGPAALAARLLFEGRTTLTKIEGLICCSMVDDAGHVAPWSEYLDINETYYEWGGVGFGSHDPVALLPSDADYILARIHGNLSLGRRKLVLRDIARNMMRLQDGISVPLVRRIANRLASETSPEIVMRLVNFLWGKVHERATAALLLGISDHHIQRDEPQQAADAAEKALSRADLSWIAFECVLNGANWEASDKYFENPDDISIHVASTDWSLEGGRELRRWIGSLRLLISTDPNIILRELDRVTGEGWYRCWLRFVLRLIEAEAKLRRGGNVSIASVFNKLTQDVRPFKGSPRACDLHPISELINETISWGLSLITEEEEFRKAVAHLLYVQKKTLTTLQNDDGGPIGQSALLEILLRSLTNPVGRNIVYEAILSNLGGVHTYYSTHGDYALIGARASLDFGDTEQALNFWSDAAVFFAAYSFRKDITLLDLFWSAKSIKQSSGKNATSALLRSRHLIDGVLVHTDGKETQYAGKIWLECLAAVDLKSALCIIAKSEMRRKSGTWWDEGALQSIGKSSSSQEANPMCAQICLASVMPNDEDTNLEWRIDPALRLVDLNDGITESILRRLVAELYDDTKITAPEIIRKVFEYAKSIGIDLPSMNKSSSEDRSSSNPSLNGRKSVDLPKPLFPHTSTISEMMASIRSIGASSFNLRPSQWDEVADALRRCLTRLADQRRESEAVKILRYFAREVWFIGRDPHPFVQLAASLSDLGYSNLAVITYVLSYTATRADWRPMGGIEQLPQIGKAISLDRDLALETFANEMPFMLRSRHNGVASHIIEVVATYEDAALGVSTWEECHKVVSHRLPLIPDGYSSQPVAMGDHADWSVDEAMVFVALARLSRPDTRVKIAILDGLCRLLQYNRDVLVRPLRYWLSRDSHASSVSLVLNVLLSSDHAAETIIALEEILNLYAAGAHWEHSVLAGKLLKRVGLPQPANHVDVQMHVEMMDSTGLEKNALDESAIEELDRVWPGMVSCVSVSAMEALLDSKENKEQEAETIDMKYGNRRQLRPLRSILCWSVELFHSKLNTQLFGLRPYLLKNASWWPEWEDDVHMLIRPNLKMHLGLYSSRIPRPDLQLPSEIGNAMVDVQIIGTEDPLYSGWYRLACVEEQFVRNSPGFSEAPPTDIYIAQSAALALPAEHTVPSDFSPLFHVQLRDAFERAHLRSVEALPNFLTFVASGADWLQGLIVPLPSFHLLRQLSVFIPPKFGEPLIWRDSDGTPAIALRYWQVRGNQDTSAYQADIKGSDLLIRPDLYEIIQKHIPIPIRYIQSIQRVSI